ncbi:Pre-rRNA-processing protein TSR1 like [Schistosoma japonicum]|nr:Pre-rRNA-processing protein TSR1 like [Schistosoma japonicum]
MTRAPHRSGPLKQQNKKHKGTKKPLDKNFKAHRVKSNKILNKDQRRLLSKQLRTQKRLEAKKFEASRGTKENPITCVLIPLSSSIPTHLAHLLFQTCEPNMEVLGKPECCLQNVVTIRSKTLNKYFDLICAYIDDLFGCLDLAKFADWLILLVPSDPSEISDSINELLIAIYAQGFTNASYAVLSSNSNCKELKQILECRFPVPESTIHQLNSSSNALNLLRHIASTNPSSFHVKVKNAKVAGQSAVANTGARYRSRLLVDSIALTSENHPNDDITKSEITVCLRGRLHGAPLILFEELDQNGSVPVGPSVHLTGWGDFPLMEAKWVGSNQIRQIWRASNLNVVKNALTKDISPSSIYLRNENNYCEDDSMSDEMSVNDSYHSANENEPNTLEHSSDNLESELSSTSDIECTSLASHTAHTMAASATSAFSSTQLARFRAARMDEMFPDEVETPPNIPACERFAKYCGLSRFQGSVWPAEKDCLPKYYSEIACFRNYHRNRRTMIRYIEQKLADFQSQHNPTGPVCKYIPSGVDVELLLQPIPRDIGQMILSHHTFPHSDESRKPSDPRPHPLLVWSLLPHETKMSVCHFTMLRRASAIHAVSDLMVIANTANKISESSIKENEDCCTLEFGEEAATKVEREDKAIHDALISHRSKISGKHRDKASYDPNMPIPLEAEPIKSKDLMLIQAGIRRFVAAPIYSTTSNPREKAKFESFFPASESSTVASVYAPVMYSPVNVLQFRIRVTEDENGELSSLYAGELVATGSLKSVDPSHLIIKRILLSGHPYRINRRHVVVRYMFHNPADILYFQVTIFCRKSVLVSYY